MRKLVGISQKIKRAWLDAVLDRLVKTTDEAELRTFLDKHLKDELPGQGIQGQDRRNHPADLERNSTRTGCSAGPGRGAAASNLRAGAHLAALGHDGPGVSVLP